MSAALPQVEVATLTHLGDKTAQYGRVRVWGWIGFIASVLAIGYVLDVLPIRVLLWIMFTILVATAIFLLVVPEPPESAHSHDHTPIAQ